MDLSRYASQIIDVKMLMDKTNTRLKDEYRGIDDVIDRVCQLVLPWMAIPDSITRPLIVCLWGMTGTGKTSLVRKLAKEHLDEPLIELDLGLFSNGKKSFSQEMYDHYADHSGSNSIILLDEIQNSRTINKDGSEMDRAGLRGLWSLLSDGIIIPDVRLEKEKCLMTMERITDAYDALGGLPPSRKERAKNLSDEEIEDPLLVDETDEIDGNEEIGCWELDYDHRNEKWEISTYSLRQILEACNRKGVHSLRKVQNMLDDDFRGTLDVITGWLKDIDIQPVLDYSKCLIFITGNVDEVYTAAETTNPDITANDLHEWSLEITVPDVKQSLLERFRAEQVARLGNNHILYPALAENDFRAIIQDDLKRIHDYYYEHFGVNFQFEQSVEDLVYAEGVFPTQGARPVLATTSSLAEGPIPVCLKEIIEKNSAPNMNDQINVSVEMTSIPPQASFYDNTNDRHIADVHLSLSVENLRTPVYDDRHVGVAIHEASHVVASVVLGGIVPLKVTAFSSEMGKDGFMAQSVKDIREEHTRVQLDAKVVTLLCGWAAEKHFFGDELLTTGSSHDLSTATEYIANYVKRFGFADDTLLRLTRTSSQNEAAGCMTPFDEKTMRNLINGFQKQAMKLVEKYEGAILDLSTIILSKPRVLYDDIREVCRRNNLAVAEISSKQEMFEGLLEKHDIDWSPE